MWYNKYIGLPYKDGGRDTSGLDCWGLVRLVYQDKYNIELPSFTSSYSTAKDREHIHELIARHKESWKNTTEPQEGSVVLLRILGTETHVGVYLGDNKFLHVREGTQAVVESVDSSMWKHRVVGFFDYQENFLEKISLTAVPNPLKTQTVQIPVLAGTNLQFLADWVANEYKTKPELISKSIFMVNGKVIPQVEWSSTKLKENDSVEYRVLPGDSSTFRMVAFFALAIYAPILAAEYGAAIGGSAFGLGIGTAAGTALVSATVMIAGSALINAIAPIRPPAEPTTPVASVAQNLINGANNQANPYAPIPVVLGKMRVTPPVGATNFVSFSGSEEIQSFSEDGASAGVSGKDTYIDMLLIWGYGPLEITQSSLRIGQVPVYKDDGSSNYDGFLIQTLDRKTEPTSTELQAFNAIYGSDVQEIFPNQSLTYPKTFPDDLEHKYLPPIKVNGAWTPEPRPVADIGWYEAGFTQSTEQIAISIQFPQGLRATIVKGGSAGQTDSAPVGFELGYQYGNDGNYNGWQSWGYYTVGGKIAEQTGSNTTKETVLLGFGENSYYEEQDVTTTTLQNAILSGGVYPDGFAWTLTKSRVVNGVELWPLNAQVQIRIRRITGDETEPNDSYRYSHAAVLYSITSFNNSSPAIDPPNTKIAKTAVTIKATGELNGQIDGINALVQTVCKDWDTATQTWIERATSNPASLYRYVLQHSANAQPVPDSEINLTQLQHWHEYCNADRSVTYNGYTYTNIALKYNAVHGNSPRSVLDILRDICAAGRASPALLDSKWTVVIDEPKTTIVQHFTTHNSWGFEATKLLPRMPEALKVQFNDSTNDYVLKEIIVSYADKSVDNAQLVESIQLPGTTTTAEAVDHAMWHLAQIKLRPEIYTINTDIEYIVCSRGDRVKVTHDVPMWGLGSARIKNTYGTAANTVSVIEFDEEFEVDITKEYTIRVRSSTGNSSTYTINKAFNISTISRSINIVTISTVELHPLNIGDVVKVTSSDISINTEYAVIESVGFNNFGPNSFTYKLTGATIASVATTGTIELTSNYYKSLQLTNSALITNVSAGDLILYGELNAESQDLIVTKIEPSTNNTAKITLVDYGVTSNFNIFTDYRNISSNNIFDANITQPSMNLLSQVGGQTPIVDPANAISDYSVMVRTAPGIYTYVIKVPYTNPTELSKDTGYVVAEVIPANTPDTSGGRLITSPITDNSITIDNVQEGSVYKYRLRYKTNSGRLGIWTPWFTHIVQGKLTNFDVVDSLLVVKSHRDLDITPYISIIPQNFKYYEIRIWKNPGTGDFWNIQDPNIRTYTSVSVISVDLRDFSSPRISPEGTQYRIACRILDTFGNYSGISTLGYITLETIKP